MAQGEATVQGVLWVILLLTVLKTALVVHAVWGIFSGAREVVGSLVRRARCLPAEGRAADTIPLTPSSRSSRLVRQRLVLMHFLASLAQLAGVWQYVVPVTESGCVVTHRVMVASLVLFDGTTVLFLLAKEQVTNNVMATSPAAATVGWECAVRKFSYFWAWVISPATALLCAVSLPGGTHEEDGRCHGGIESFDGDVSTLVFFVAFTAGKLVLTVEFMLLLALFVKPLYARDADGQLSASPRHRRTVFRNIACTVGVVAVELAELIVVLTVVYHKGSTEKVERSADVAAILQVFLILLLTEITMPVSFASLFGSAKSKPGSKKNGSNDPEFGLALSGEETKSGGSARKKPESRHASIASDFGHICSSGETKSGRDSII